MLLYYIGILLWRNIFYLSLIQVKELCVKSNKNTRYRLLNYISKWCKKCFLHILHLSKLITRTTIHVGAWFGDNRLSIIIKHMFSSFSYLRFICISLLVLIIFVFLEEIVCKFLVQILDAHDLIRRLLSTFVNMWDDYACCLVFPRLCMEE